MEVGKQTRKNILKERISQVLKHLIEVGRYNLEGFDCINRSLILIFFFPFVLSCFVFLFFDRQFQYCLSMVLNPSPAMGT